jgi:hypothetical protein
MVARVFANSFKCHTHKQNTVPNASFVCTVGEGCTLDGVAWAIPSDVFGVVWKELVLVTLCVSYAGKGMGQNILSAGQSEHVRRHTTSATYYN